MEDSRAGLAGSFRRMSDEELLERWSSGCLTDIAIEVAKEELALREVPAPPYVSRESDEPPADRHEALEPVEVARSHSVMELQLLAARLESEGIPSLIVNENTNRMGPQFSNSAGGSSLLVALQYAGDAREIVDLLNKGEFAIRDGEDLGPVAPDGGSSRPLE